MERTAKLDLTLYAMSRQKKEQTAWANLNPYLLLTARDYLAWEAEQAGKHEYYYGEVFAKKNKLGTILTMNGDLSAKAKIT
ncbi:MAG: hypothetical protein EA399_01050 [Desulfovibrionales bacterium]|nr:MAG: hypothetical protein EA399_01050 [Desulfovibrionales bacterium]